MELKQNERIDDLGINNLKLIQNRDYFCFGTDSALLANFVTNSNHNNVVMDLCTGSGVVPILMSAKIKYSKIFGVELQEEMFELFKRNIELNKLDIYMINSNILDIKKIREIVKNETGRERVDVITVNPPYKPKGRGVTNENKVKYIARHEEECTLEDIFKVSSALLESKGKMYIVHKPERIVDLLSIARKYRLEAKKIRYVYPKVSMKPSIVLIEYSKDGGNETLMLKPLIEFNDDGTYTDEMYEIYGMERKNGK